MKTSREQALEWWNNLPLFIENSKHHYSDRYYPNRGHNSLTGREIEKIWEKETQKPVYQQIIDTVGGEEKFCELAGLTKKQVDFELLQEMYLHTQSGKNALCGHWIENFQLFIELLAKSSTFAHKAHKELKKLNV